MATERSIPRLTLLAFILAALSTGACNVVGGSCNCPATGGFIPVPDTLPPVASVQTTDPACGATFSPPHDVQVTRSSPGSCAVLITLTNGDVYAATATFKSLGSGCCGNLQVQSGHTDPVLVDAGAGGG
jgi:hypothetical protein